MNKLRDYREQIENITLKAVLPVGEENAITTNDLIEKLGVSGIEAVKHIVRNERIKNQVPICSKTSNHGGYFLPKDKKEIASFYYGRVRRNGNEFSMLKTFKDIINETEGQMKIDIPLSENEQELDSLIDDMSRTQVERKDNEENEDK